MYQVINLSIAHPRVEQKLEIVAKYKVDTEFLAFDSTRRRITLLTNEEDKRCKTNALGSFGAASPIYVVGNHRLCVFELFRGDKKKIEDSCQIVVLTDSVLPQAICISDGIWTVATNMGLDLSKVCEGSPTMTIKLIPCCS